jgi:palmitoyl-protein thioesterase
MAVKALLLVLSFIAFSKAADLVPLVVWHGMGDTCCFPFSIGGLIKTIQKHAPGLYVQSIEVGNSIEEDELNGFFMNVNNQIDMVCKNLSANENLKQGFNSMGFSQGGQFLRALVQRCPGITMRNLISVGGQHQGVYGFPHCNGNETLCDIVRKLLNIGAYVGFIQDFLVQAEFWHDPLNEAEYKKKCVFLPDINQENTFNADYKDRLSKLTNLILVKFTEDTMVQPRESEWFGFYKPGQNKEMYTLFESDLYTKDLLGLKGLNDTGRLHFLAAPFDHLQFTEQWFFDNLFQYINVNFDDLRKKY